VTKTGRGGTIFSQSLLRSFKLLSEKNEIGDYV